MLKYDILIIHSKKITTRKEHVCDSCGKKIRKGTKCLFIKTVNFKQNRFIEIRRHLDCPDRDHLIHINKIDDPKPYRESIKKISAKGNHS